VDLWTKLKKIDVDEGVEHPFFGHPERILKALVEEKYVTSVLSACFAEWDTALTCLFILVIFAKNAPRQLLPLVAAARML
jgi:hypothetical protein